MSEYVEAFGLGNAAILTNVCILPLYPGLFALLASHAGDGRDEKNLRWMGALVLAGIISVMVAVAFALHQVNRVFADALPYILPIAYGIIIVLGFLMILGRNPLARLTTGQIPIVKSPAAGAFVYGLALGPMTLPCTGPVILSAFTLGSIGGSGELLDGIVYFAFFGLGFGWPLVLLPLLAGPAQRRFTSFLTRNHKTVQTAAGVLLVLVAIFGLAVDFELA